MSSNLVSFLLPFEGFYVLYFFTSWCASSQSGILSEVNMLVQAAAKCFWNACLPLAQRADLRASVRSHLVLLLEHVQNIPITEPNKKKDKEGGKQDNDVDEEDDDAESIQETDEEREMRDLATLCMQLYTLMFKCLEDEVWFFPVLSFE